MNAQRHPPALRPCLVPRAAGSFPSALLSVAALVLAATSLACAPATARPAPGDQDAPSDGLPLPGAPDPGGEEEEPPPPPPRGGGDWPQYRGNVEGTWTIPGSVTADDARAASLDWMAELGEYGWTQPVIAGDTVVATTGFSGRVVALEADTGAVRWSRTLNHVFEVACDDVPRPHGFYAAAALHEGAVLAASPDGRLYALAEEDGTMLWEVQVADPHADGEFVQSSPAVSARLGKVFLGVGASFKCAPVDSRVLSVDLRSRALSATPLNPEGRKGSSVWSSLSVDEEAAVVHVTTGDPAGQPYDDLPLSQAFATFDAQGLSLIDHWQNRRPAPEGNSDFGASPTLFTDAAGRELVASANKDGRVYALLRDDLGSGPLWEVEIAVPGDPMMGQSSLVSPTFAHGLLIAAGGETPSGEPGAVVAVDPATGAERWRHTPPGFVMAGMPSTGDLLVVASNREGFEGSTLELLDVRTGQVLNRFESDAPTLGAPSIGRGRILWYRYDGTLQAIRLPVQ